MLRMNLNQITVPSLDLTKSIPFYERLGLKLIVKSLPHYARFECPNGNSTFSIHQTEKLPQGKRIYVYFECENLDEQEQMWYQYNSLDCVRLIFQPSDWHS